MQTTLLGLAIAFILALLAALIGPYYVDWNQFRPQFEAEASQVIGVPVRVAGTLDARLLPTPTLRLRSVTFGGPNDLGKLRADTFDVEFSLGDLMRGEWRANELTISGMAADLGLDPKGRVDLPPASGKFNLGSLSIDRLNLTGRVALHDAVSHGTVELNDIVFSGDVRSLAGSLRGDGSVAIQGARYPFRVSSSQDKDSSGLRVHLNIDPGERPLVADVEGLISFASRAPRFEGAVTLSSPPETKDADKTAKEQPAKTKAPPPWKVSAKVAAEQTGAKLDQLEASFGREDQALKFTGAGQMRFGAAPLLRAVLSARQLDGDKLLASNDNRDRNTIAAARVLPALRAWLATLPALPLPARVQLNAEQIMLGGRPIQNATVDMRGGTEAWGLERVDLSAPGATHLSLSSAAGSKSDAKLDAAGFSGTLDLDSSDPQALVAWLQGRGDTSFRGQRPLRVHGDLQLASDRVAIEGLKAETEGGAVEGRVALIGPSTGAGSRIEANLKGERLDLDATAALVRSLAGPSPDWPEQAAISLDIGRAIASGQELKPLTANVAYDPKTITIDQIKFGQGEGVTTEGSGRFSRADATGRLRLTSNAASLSQMTALLQPVAPKLAARLDAVGQTPGAAQLKLTLDLTKDAKSADHADARGVLEFDVPQLKGTATLTAKPWTAALQRFDLDAIGRTEVSLDTKMAAAQGDVLLTLLGLDRVASVNGTPLQFEANASGAWRAPTRVSLKLSGAGLDGEAQGTAELWSASTIETAKANLALRIRSANLSPLVGLKPQDATAQNVRVFGRLGLSAGRLTLDDLDSTVGGAHLLGHLAMTLDDDKQIDGEIGLDKLDLPAVFALGIGAVGHDSADPLGAGMLKGWHGRVAFQALSGALPGGGELRPAAGAIKSDGRTVTIDNLRGRLGGGNVSATIDARPGANGLALNGRIELAGVDGAALSYHGLKLPAAHVSAQATLATEGRSVQAFVNSLSGNGTLTLDAVSIPGLDPRVFETAIKASDAGQVTDDVKLRQIVDPALASGPLTMISAQVPFIIRDGRLRVSPTTLDAKDARAIVSGGYDIPADQADIRASLSATAIGNANSHPEVQLFIVGPPDALNRTVDVTPLSSWLAVRTIDRETRRLDAIARGEMPPPNPPSTAALPATPETVVPPNLDPRRTDPRAKLGAPRAPALPPAPLAAPANPPPAMVPPVVSQQAPPLPPPLEVRPAPGAAFVKPKPRGPLVLTPQVTNP